MNKILLSACILLLTASLCAASQTWQNKLAVYRKKNRAQVKPSAPIDSQGQCIQCKNQIRKKQLTIAQPCNTTSTAVHYLCKQCAHDNFQQGSFSDDLACLFCSVPYAGKNLQNLKTLISDADVRFLHTIKRSNRLSPTETIQQVALPEQGYPRLSDRVCFAVVAGMGFCVGVASMYLRTKLEQRL